MERASIDHSGLEAWTRRRLGLVAGGALTAWLGLSRPLEAVAKKRHHKRPQRGKAQHEQAELVAVGDSGVGGFVTLQQPPKKEGPSIVVHATGLTPDTEYVSLYYDNKTCELEPYSEDDVIGGPYTANAAGNGQTHGEADDDIDDIGSVSVRLASDFTLLACATLPGGEA